MGFGVKDVGGMGTGRAGATGVESLDVGDDGDTEGAMLDGAPDSDGSDESDLGKLADDGDALGGNGDDGGETADNDGSEPAAAIGKAAGVPGLPAGMTPEKLAELQAFHTEFGQHAPALRQFIGRSLNPQQQMQAAQQQAAQPAKPAYQTPFTDKKVYDKWWQDATDDHKVFLDGMFRELENAPFVQKIMERLGGFDKHIESLKSHTDQVRGRVTFDNWIRANKAEKLAPRIEELIEKHGVNDIKTAHQMARDEADAKAWRDAQAKAAKAATGAGKGKKSEDDDEESEAPARKKPLPPATSGARNRSVGGKGSGNAQRPAEVTRSAGSGSLMRAAVGSAVKEYRGAKKK